MERPHRAGITIAGLLLSLSVTGSAAAGDALVRELAADVAAPRLADDIATLAGFDARQPLSETIFDSRGIGAARRWIEAAQKPAYLARTAGAHDKAAKLG